MTDMELEKSFAEDESDDAPNTASVEAAVVSPAPASSKAVNCTPELLNMYYSRLFPFSLLYDWLSYGNNTSIFSKREFSFTIEPVPDEEIYIRYQSFTTQEELAKAITKRCPKKIDIGAVFSHPPKEKDSLQSGQIKPELRELVFDVDLTDYDSVRKCGCSGAQICRVCWGFMPMAVKVMDQALREDFGFEHIAWFYSGRRGVHAWVCDEIAQSLTDEARHAIAGYFEVNLGSDNNKEVELHNPLHPMLARAFELLEPMFIDQLLPASGHGLLASPENCLAFLDELPEAAAPIRERFLPYWTTQFNNTTPAEKWQMIKEHLTAFLSVKKGAAKVVKSMSTKERNRIENWPVEMVFRHGYPRLDVNVSKSRNHLLKSPFCVHPKTGRVCVPIVDVDAFDPFTVPTLPELEQELKKLDTPADWKQTSLKEYFEGFESKFLNPLMKVVRRKQRDEAEQKAAIAGDF